MIEMNHKKRMRMYVLPWLLYIRWSKQYIIHPPYIIRALLSSNDYFFFGKSNW